MRTRTLLLASALLFGAQGIAQNFDGFNYQAVIRNTAGDPLPNQAVAVRFTIVSGILQPHIETYAVTTDAQGMIKLSMGQGTLQSGPAFSAIDWSNNNAWTYCVEVDITGGSNYQPLGCENFKAVPFAMRALTSDAGPPSGWAVYGPAVANTNTGNVGIGTTSPAAKLEINANDLGFRQSNGTVRADLSLTSTDAYFGTTTANHHLHLRAGGLDDMIIRGDNHRVGMGRNPTDQKLEVEGGAYFSGKVGIGTTTPASKLDVEGGVSVGSTYSGATVAPSNGMIIEGNVGIGTTSPAEKLTVRTATANFGFAHTDGTITVGSFVGGVAGGGWYGTRSNHNLNFFTNNSTAQMTLATSGRVGIGTTTPQQKLDVLGNAIVRGTEFNSNGDSAVVYVGDAASRVQNTYGTGLQLFTYPGSNPGITIVSGTNDVGIGTTTPQSKLSVNGKITCKEVEVTLAGFPDYVFEKNYNLMPLAEVEAYIAANGHLPNVPSACEVEESGLGLGEMNRILLEKVEELTLHAIAKEKEVEALNARVAQMEAILLSRK